MLDVERPADHAYVKGRVSGSKIHQPLGFSAMPVDFASYLLSASPPGFDVHYTLRDHFGICNGMGRTDSLKSIIFNSKSDSSLSTTYAQDDDDDDDDVFPSEASRRRDARHSISTSVAMPCIGRQRRLGKKRVSFADDLGFELATVRIMTESSRSPPCLRPDVISSLTRGASACVADTPSLALNFSQPASDYVRFRERLERDSVSLENVILRDYRIMGTVKVKNVAYEKSVRVRCTFDGWQTHTDINTDYVPANGSGYCPYDTFAFEVNVSPTMDTRHAVHFAIVYEAGGREYWDNNNGINYEVVSASKTQAPVLSASGTGGATTCPHKEIEVDTIFSLDLHDNWTEFSWSRHMGSDSNPYW